MNNKGSDLQTVSIKRANSKAQISGYLLKNKDQLPQEIILSWQNFQEIEELLNNQIEADLKRINSRVGKKKNIDFQLLAIFTLLPFIASAFVVRLIKPKMLNLYDCIDNIEQYQFTNNQKP